MTYTTIKYIKGNPYLYEVRSERDGDRVKQVFVRYLGRAGSEKAERMRAEAEASPEYEPPASRTPVEATSETKPVERIPTTPAAEEQE